MLPPSAESMRCVRLTENHDLPTLLGLFQRSFGSPLLEARWHWKYAHAPFWGTTVERGGEVIAFFGGMPRQFAHGNDVVLGVQIGDVMVDPTQRGILTRKGAMFMSASIYFEQMTVLYPAAQFAYGFPSARHLQLGCKLGLYAEIDTISVMSWAPLPPQRSLLTPTRCINEWPVQRQQQAVNRLWQAMRVSWPQMLLPVRDATWLQHRYLDHPEHAYELLLVSSRLTGQPKALVVVRAHHDHLEFLDYVGPAQGVGLALRAARMHAANLGLPIVRGWFSQQLTRIFNVGQPTVHASGITVPTNLWGKAQVASVLSSPLWLMAGDSDFR